MVDISSMDKTQAALRLLVNRVWHRRRISWQLSIGFGVMVLIMMLALIKANFQVQMVTNVSRHFATTELPRLMRIQALSLHTESVSGSLTRLMYAERSQREREYVRVDGLNSSIEGLIATLAKDTLDTRQRFLLSELVSAREKYHDAFVATAELIEAGDIPAASEVIVKKVNPTLEVLQSNSNSLLDYERERLESDLARGQRTFDEVAALLIGLSFMATAIALLLAIKTIRSIVSPLSDLENAAHRIAQGDYAVNIAPTGVEEFTRVGQSINSMIAAVVQREQKISQLAYFDSLTGLPNRASLFEPPTSGGRAYDGIALLEFARLQTVNETLGYSTGDSLIQAIALRVQTHLNQTPSLAGAIIVRLSGGSMALAWHETSRDAILSWLERLAVAMAAPVYCSGHSVDANFVVGLADNESSTVLFPIQTLLRNAEVALNYAKRGKLGFAWYSATMDASRLSHLSLVSDLRLAVAESQLQMWLQPKFDLRSGSAVGAEALVRWRHPQRGFISPSEFVPFAEQTGYISMLTSWMVEHALIALVGWHEEHPDLYIAVNISTHDLSSANFRFIVASLLRRHQVNPERLRLEIVESGLMEDPQASVTELRALRNMGIALAIDDFGTGYSSLAYLQKLPVNELKIDRSFVHNIDQQETTQRLFKTMVDMGHALGLSITAEGVETEAERGVIAALGCEVMQGYLGSRPLHGEALEVWLKSQNGAINLNL